MPEQQENQTEVFHLKAPFKPTGDQPQAIEALVQGLKAGDKGQTLLGVTGSGKTFTMANIIAQCNRPTLILEPNKTLASQICTEMRGFFPDDAVEYFVSYYDYYQPEAYIPSTDTYIEKDSAINDEIDRLRHSATAALSERRNVIIVASVSCIYSLGDPIDYRSMVISLRPGMQMERDELCRRLVKLQYERNDMNFIRNKFRVHGDIVDIHLAYNDEYAIRVEFFGDEIDRISEFDPLTGERKNIVRHVAIFPASHYIVGPEKMKEGLAKIQTEMEQQVQAFTAEGKLLEAQRIQQRTQYDMEMLQEVGMCKGIENYSAVLSGRAPGSTPTTLLDYFPKDFILMVDESHVMLPQVRGMFGGDYSRKKTLVEYGFRLPSAFDNRPLKFEEFESKVGQTIFVSATPGPYEREHSSRVAEQVIRPTGLLDPVIMVRPVEGQIENLLGEILQRIDRGAVRQGGRARDFEEAIEWLVSAGMLNRIYNVSKMEHPLSAFDKLDQFKLFLFDTGLLKHMAGIDNGAILLRNNFQFKGPLTENYVLQQLRGQFPVAPRYYASQGSEIDFVLQNGTEIIPVEAKGGEDKSAPSFKRYIAAKHPAHALRFSERGYRKDGEITNLPLYLARKTKELL